ncbi:MAG: glycosyltransferase family 2 protein [Verrucomicrobia bacterium]|nr:glycosyltransferase family 2 protein [Verrucomicrobiota bacterium]
MLAQITPLILTFNEAPNIERVLDRLLWARRIVVVDSFSTDETKAICRKYPQVEFIQRPFDNHTNQWNFGLDQIRTEWVLTLDADYVLNDALNEALPLWQPDQADAYNALFRYCVAGRPLRGSLYPARPVLFRPARYRYHSDGHTQRLAVPRAVGSLPGFILHDDRKPFSNWLQAQDRYTKLEVKKLLTTSVERLALPDRVRRMIIPAPILVLFYTLLVRGLILDGWPGWYYVLQRTLAEMMLSLRLLEQKLKS